MKRLLSVCTFLLLATFALQSATVVTYANGTMEKFTDYDIAQAAPLPADVQKVDFGHNLVFTTEGGGTVRIENHGDGLVYLLNDNKGDMFTRWMAHFVQLYKLQDAYETTGNWVETEVFMATNGDLRIEPDGFFWSVGEYCCGEAPPPVDLVDQARDEGAYGVLLTGNVAQVYGAERWMRNSSFGRVRSFVLAFHSSPATNWLTAGEYAQKLTLNQPRYVTDGYVGVFQFPTAPQVELVDSGLPGVKSINIRRTFDWVRVWDGKYRFTDFLDAPYAGMGEGVASIWYGTSGSDGAEFAYHLGRRGVVHMGDRSAYVKRNGRIVRSEQRKVPYVYEELVAQVTDVASR